MWRPTNSRDEKTVPNLKRVMHYCRSRSMPALTAEVAEGIDMEGGSKKGATKKVGG